MQPPVIFIFGHGCVGRAFGHMMAAAEWSARGTTRQPENFTAERGAGWDLIPFRDRKNTGPCARPRWGQRYLIYQFLSHLTR